MAYVQVANMVCLKLRNLHFCKGCIFPEDDWGIEAFGETYEEAVRRAALDYRIADILVRSASVGFVTCFYLDTASGKTL